MMASNQRQSLERGNGKGRYDHKVTVNENGNSLAVNMVSDVVDDLNIVRGDEVGLIVDEEARTVTLEFPPL